MAKFGTDGIRGLANTGALTAEAVLRLGQVLGVWLREHHRDGARVLVVRDSRRSGPMIEGALAAGLASRGVSVGRGRILPTPALAVCVPAHGYQLGVVLSASHNPGPDNGIKVFGADGRKLDDAAQADLEARLAGDGHVGDAPTGDGLGAITPDDDARETYIRDLVAAGAVAGAALAGVRVALDCAYGATAATTVEIFQRLGATVVPVAAEPDGDRINDGVGSMHPGTLAAAVRDAGAVVGFAFDGDGDRLICIDEHGTVRDGDAVLYVLARDMAGNRTLAASTVVGTVMTNLGLEQALARQRITVERTPVGDRHVAARCTTDGFTLGGEPSGHVLLWREGTLRGDATLTALEVIGTMLRRGRYLSELCDGFTPFPQVQVAVRVHERPPLEGIPAVRDALAEARALLGESGRIIARYSGTEPVARIMLEGAHKETLEAQAGRIAWAIRESLGDRRNGTSSDTTPDTTPGTV